MAKTDNYPLFMHWYKTNDWILDKCEKIPRSVRYTIAGRLGNMSMDVLELIIQAIYTKDRKPFLEKINLELEKMRILFRICKDRKYISEAQYYFIFNEINTAGKMCGGWLQA